MSTFSKNEPPAPTPDPQFSSPFIAPEALILRMMEASKVAMAPVMDVLTVAFIHGSEVQWDDDRPPLYHAFKDALEDLYRAGFALVPLKPTESMIKAGQSAFSGVSYEEHKYCAMIEEYLKNTEKRP